jgi:hypothetical protein
MMLVFKIATIALADAFLSPRQDDDADISISDNICIRYAAYTNSFVRGRAASDEGVDIETRTGSPSRSGGG